MCPMNAGIKRSYGWKKQAFDPRDVYQLVPNSKTRKLNPTVDLSSGMGPQLDQGGEGSCGPNTADELITFDQKAEELPLTYASRLFIYWYTRYLMGTVNQDSGVDNRTMLKALATYGFPPESMWPYDDTPQSMVKQPTPDVVAVAALNKVTDYAAVVQSLTQMQGTLASGKPFMFGFNVFQQMESQEAAATGIVTDPSPGDTPIGGHDISACGYNGSANDLPGVLPGNRWPSGYFKFRNHWMNTTSVPWGDGGYAYLSFTYATDPNLANDFWLINSIPTGGVIPTPTPTPTPTPIPIPTPTPTPVPPGVKQQIDAVFAMLEAKFRGHPAIIQVLKYAQSQVDKILSQSGYARAGTVPTTVIAVVDAALDAAAAQYPQYAPIIAVLKMAVNAYLPLL